MNNIKRPRPAVPVLVHVDNPSEIDNAEVAEEVKSLSNAVGTRFDSAQRQSLVSMTSDMRKALNDSTEAVENIHSNIGTTTDLITDTTVIGLLKKIKENTTGGGGGSGGGVDMTTVNTNTTQINNNIGTSSDTTDNTTVIGRLANIQLTDSNTYTQVSDIKETTYVLNAKLGNISETDASGTIMGRLTDLQGKSSAMNTALGTASSEQNANDVIGKLKQIQLTDSDTYTQVAHVKSATDIISQKLGVVNETATSGTVLGRLTSLKQTSSTISSYTQDINTRIGTASDTATYTTVLGRLTSLHEKTNAIKNNVGFTTDQSNENTIIGLLKAIKGNGGAGTGADMTTVNTKTTAINAAIGATSDESTANTVIGLLKRIIQNN